MSVDVVGIGRAYAIDYVRPHEKSGSRVKMRKDHWFAWKGNASTGSLIIVDVIGKADVALSDMTIAQHRTFHNHDPNGALEILWHSPKLPVKILGLVHAIMYDARGIPSSKDDNIYRHEFGDFGAHKHDDDKYRPSLAIDQTGHFYIVRRPGNAYHFNKWVVG